ncbi:uncharacterized protein LOC133737236 [Rosa rugosa]|uniref:uncharacterized protein LOC133737236 n=1 Tax=Rosa rugosa TaxID=74645 RepID=UPI002B406F7F|nr:uncharacterized protein LOC133737236 [Rosa rugosa]
MGSINLHPGILRLIQWTPSFSPATYKNTFAQVWVRFWDLGFAYWETQTLFEIASGIGMPVKLDPRTANRSIGLYARILIDVDLSKPPIEKLQIRRASGEIISVGVEYETCPTFCDVCCTVGHPASKCRSKVPSDQSPARGRSVTRTRTARRRQPKRESGMRREQSNETPSSLVAAHTDIAQPTLIIPEIDTSLAVQVHAKNALMVQDSSSIASVPPGFSKLDGTPEVGTCRNELETTDDVTSIRNQEVNANDVIPIRKPEVLLDEALEEGEFTPVVTKKAKKLQKRSEKVKVKPKPGLRARVQKSAKHFNC